MTNKHIQICGRCGGNKGEAMAVVAGGGWVAGGLSCLNLGRQSQWPGFQSLPSGRGGVLPLTLAAPCGLGCCSASGIISYLVMVVWESDLLSVRVSCTHASGSLACLRAGLPGLNSTNHNVT